MLSTSKFLADDEHCALETLSNPRELREGDSMPDCLLAFESDDDLTFCSFHHVRTSERT